MRSFPLLHRLFCAAALLLAAYLPATAQDFANSLGSGADPGVTYYNGYYYGSYTGAIDKSQTPAAGTQRLILFRSPNLEDLFTSTDQNVIVITSADGGFWAPYPQFFNGHMYIYYTNPEATKSSNCGSGAAGPCKTFVAVSNTADPFGTYTMSKNQLPGYDFSVLPRSDGTLWAFSTTFGGPSLQAGQLQTSDPTLLVGSQTNLDSDMTTIADVGLSWEKICLEASQPFVHAGTIYLNYSTAGWRSVDYKLGLLTFTGPSGGPLDVASSWTKSTQPVFESANNIVSTGSNSVVVSPDNGFWNLYTERYGSADAGRNIGMQRITWPNGNDNPPVFVQPSAVGVLLSRPNNETGASTSFLPDGTYPSTNPQIVYSQDGGWSLHGTVKSNDTLDSFALVKTNAGQLQLWSPTGPDYGEVSVFVDGTQTTTIDLYSPTASTEAVQVYTSRDQGVGEHTFLFVNLNHQDANSNGTKFGVDHVIITN